MGGGKLCCRSAAGAGGYTCRCKNFSCWKMREDSGDEVSIGEGEWRVWVVGLTSDMLFAGMCRAGLI